MKLSEDPDYLRWGTCFAAGEYQQAIAHIEAVLQRARAAGDGNSVAYLIGVIAKTCVEMGDMDLAARKFEEQDAASDGDPTGRFFIARFWSELHDRPDLALVWLQRIVARRDAEIASGLPQQHRHDAVVETAREMIGEMQARVTGRRP